jgi:type IV pilus assembly protein PilB
VATDDTFLRAITEDSDDDAPRLVYADWLEEQGQTARAEFIRVQCGLARGLGGAALEARERELLEAHQVEWLGPLRRWAKRWTFRRGFLVEVAVSTRVYLHHRNSLSLLAPLARFAADLSGAAVPPSVLERLPESVARENIVLPLGWRGRVLVVAVQDPADWDLFIKLQFILNCDIEPIPAPADQLAEAINSNYGDTEVETVTTFWLTDPPMFYVGEVEANQPPFDFSEVEDDNSPVARLVDLIIQEALLLRATEIRITPQEDCLQVHYRINGEMVERDRLPLRLHALIVERLRLLADAIPGRIRGQRHGVPFDLDIDIEATVHGPCVVITPLPGEGWG